MESRSHRCAQLGQVAVAQFVEPAESAQPALGAVGGFGRRDVTPGEDGHHLLDRHRLARDSSAMS